MGNSQQRSKLGAGNQVFESRRPVSPWSFASADRSFGPGPDEIESSFRSIVKKVSWLCHEHSVAAADEEWGVQRGFKLGYSLTYCWLRQMNPA